MYVLDANVFIEAKNRYYSFDLAPSFWTWLIVAHDLGKVCSVDAVYKELTDGSDALADWAKNHREFFKEPNQNTLQAFPKLSDWVNSQPYQNSAKNKFFDSLGDYHLIAFAMGDHYQVVTHERSNPNSRANVKIPDVCTGLGVPVLDPFQMLRELGVRFNVEWAATISNG